MRFRVAAMITAISLFACGGNVVVDNGSSSNGGQGGASGGHGGTNGVGAFTSGSGMSTGDVNPVGTGSGGFGGTMSTGDVNPVGTGTGGLGGTMSTGDVNPVGVGVSVGGSSAAGPSMCMSFTCSEGSNGACACKGQCGGGETVTVTCGPNGGLCHCRKNGALLGTCAPTPAGCQLPGSCCDALF